MTDDLVKQLRFYALRVSASVHEDCDQAADRIEQQAAEIERLRAALEPFVRSCHWVKANSYPIRISNDYEASAWDLLPEDIDTARAALGDTQ